MRTPEPIRTPVPTRPPAPTPKPTAISKNLGLTLESPTSGSALKAEFTEPSATVTGRCEAEGQPVILWKVDSKDRQSEVARTLCNFGQWLIDINLMSLKAGVTTFCLRHLNALGESQELELAFELRHPGIKRFMTGFGEGVSEDLEPGGESAVDLRGADAGAGPRNFTSDLEALPFGDFGFDVTGGSSAQRSVRIAPERGVAELGARVNRVLRFTLSDAPTASNVGTSARGRVEATLAGKSEIKELYEKVRVRLGPGFRFVTDGNAASEGIALAQWAAVTVKLVRSGADPGAWRLAIAGPGWSELSTDLDVPIDRWFTLEYDFKPGDEKSGRLFVALTIEGGQRRVVFDDSPRRTIESGRAVVDSLKALAIMKLEAGKELLSPLKSASQKLEIEWDDLEIWTDGRGP